MDLDQQIPSPAEHSAALDAALGLESITIKLPSEAMREIEREAEAEDLPASQLVRIWRHAYLMQSEGRRNPASAVYLDIIAERARQNAKWGGPDHDDQRGLEDFCTFINQRTADLARGFESSDFARKKMIQIAALAVAAIESMDRKDAARAVQGDKSIPSPDRQDRAILKAEIQSNTSIKVGFDVGHPSVPPAVVDAITAYGDARADGDIALCGERLAACIRAIRPIMQAPIRMTTERPTSPGWYWYTLPGSWAIQPALVDEYENELWYWLDAIPVGGPDDGFEMAQCSDVTLWSERPIQTPEDCAK